MLKKTFLNKISYFIFGATTAFILFSLGKEFGLGTLSDSILGLFSIGTLEESIKNSLFFLFGIFGVLGFSLGEFFLYIFYKENLDITFLIMRLFVVSFHLGLLGVALSFKEKGFYFCGIIIAILLHTIFNYGLTQLSPEYFISISFFLLFVISIYGWFFSIEKIKKSFFKKDFQN